MKKHDGIRHVPMRACAACRVRKPRAELLRFVRRGDRVTLDVRRRAPGRGLNLCPRRECFEKAVKKSVFGHRLRHPLRVSGDELRAEVRTELLKALSAGRAAAGGCAEASFDSGVDWRPDFPEVDPSLGGPTPGLEPGLPGSPPNAYLAWLAEALREFTFPGPGGMNRRPAAGVPRAVAGKKSRSDSGEKLA